MELPVKKKHFLILAVSVLLIAAVISAYAIVMISRLPFVLYNRLNILADTICEDHIYWVEGDDPMLYAYQTVFQTDDEPSERLMRKEILRYLRESDENYYTFANSMLSRYEHYSSLTPREVYDELYPENENYGGLGLVITACDPFIRVVRAYPDSAAGKAGIMDGDMIAYINDTDIRPMTYDEASVLMGELSSSGGSLGVIREGESGILTFDLIPAEVVIPNVDWRVDGEIAYLNLTLFEGDEYKGLIDAAFADFRDAGASRLVLDMRDNRGGKINLLIYTLEALTAEKDVLQFSEVTRTKKTEHFSAGTGMAFENVVVIANQDTCSSAEVCAGYMKDRGYEVVGTTTYGKSTGLSYYDFYGDSLVLATIDVLLPKTGSYNAKGITPTIEVGERYQRIELPELLELDTETPVDRDGGTERIMALEQRLYVLGYLFSEPDGIWEEDTEAAVGEAAALTGSDGAEPEVLRLLEELTNTYASSRYFVDQQLETAYRLVEEENSMAA